LENVFPQENLEFVLVSELRSVGVGYGSVVMMSPQYEYWSFNLY